MIPLRYLIRYSRPLLLVGAALTFTLGAGVARYLGASIDWGVYLLGQIWITLMQLSSYYLFEFFDDGNDTRDIDLNSSRDNQSNQITIIPRETTLWISIACLAVDASIAVLLINNLGFIPEVYLLMLIIFLGSFFYGVPPIRIAYRGYGELIVSILIATLFPIFAFLLQIGEFHRIIAMVTFPITAFLLAMIIIFELPEYARDIKYDRQVLSVRMGWQNTMILHNILIICGYGLLIIALVFGLPVNLVFPVLFTLPIGGYQIWMLNKISDGARPNWKLLKITATTLFILPAYLLTFAFWTR
jgi:1,4-dihydroxy-2-naphthoate octaprenyltransferase